MNETYLPERHTVNAVTGCWIWLGPLDSEGYGKSGNTSAHRMYYLSYVGEIPKALQLDHLCVQRRCVNPAHLEPVTAKENVMRALAYRDASHSPRRNPNPKPRGYHDTIRPERCIHGHVLTDENTYVFYQNGARRFRCLECNRIRGRNKPRDRREYLRARRRASPSQLEPELAGPGI